MLNGQYECDGIKGIDPFLDLAEHLIGDGICCPVFDLQSVSDTAIVVCKKNKLAL